MFRLAWILAFASAAISAPQSPFTRSVQPFLAANCYSCHNSRIQSGNLDLTSYTSPESITADRKHWEEVVRKLKTGEMPPKGLPRPAAAQVEAVTAWIE